jgi:soluble lytic murein transglycosylase-like protein
MGLAIVCMAVQSSVAHSYLASSRASSDDLSQGFVSPDASAYRSMTTPELAGILADRLDPVAPGEVQRLAQHILLLCRKYQLDVSFVLGMIQAESGFHARIVSEAGAVGLMQIMPATAQVILRDKISAAMLMDPFTNVRAGIAYLAYLRDRYQGFSPYYVLAAYNLGPAKLDELRAKRPFHPNKSQRYFESVWRGMLQFRQSFLGNLGQRDPHV